MKTLSWIGHGNAMLPDVARWADTLHRCRAGGFTYLHQHVPGKTGAMPQGLLVGAIPPILNVERLAAAAQLQHTPSPLLNQTRSPTKAVIS